MFFNDTGRVWDLNVFQFGSRKKNQWYIQLTSDVQESLFILLGLDGGDATEAFEGKGMFAECVCNKTQNLLIAGSPIATDTCNQAAGVKDQLVLSGFFGLPGQQNPRLSGNPVLFSVFPFKGKPGIFRTF